MGDESNHVGRNGKVELNKREMKSRTNPTKRKCYNSQHLETTINSIQLDWPKWVISKQKG